MSTIHDECFLRINDLAFCCASLIVAAAHARNVDLSEIKEQTALLGTLQAVLLSYLYAVFGPDYQPDDAITSQACIIVSHLDAAINAHLQARKEG